MSCSHKTRGCIICILENELVLITDFKKEKSMSGVYCDKHRIEYRGKYRTSWKMPVGYPNHALLCCRTDCLNPGMIGLSSEEDAAYQRDERIFTCGHFVRIQVQ